MAFYLKNPKCPAHIVASQTSVIFCLNLHFPHDPNPTVGLSLRHWPLFLLVCRFCFLLLPRFPCSSPPSLLLFSFQPPLRRHVRQQLLCTCVSTHMCLLSSAELLICARTTCYLQESQNGFLCRLKGDPSVKYVRLFSLRPPCWGEDLDGWILFVPVTPQVPLQPQNFMVRYRSLYVYSI